MLTNVCCMRLNTYGAIISWLSIIISVLGTVVCSVAIAHDVFDFVEIKTLKVVLVAGLYVFLTLLVVNIVASVMLAVGVIQKRHLLMLPWLMNNGLLLVCLTLFCITLWTLLAVYHESLKLILIVFLVVAAILVLGWYMYYGMYSLFKTIQAHRESPGSVHFESGLSKYHM
ncbi:hypothetical protein KR084_012146 [Drosophila pseudotakahashii]|nr:hypothetical protein KR084_012146 [Drosophila pseudotakahashii]